VRLARLTQIASQNTIAFLSKGAKTFQPTSIQIGQVYQITEARNGKLWMAETTRSVRPLPLGTKTLPSDETEVRVGSTGIIFRQDGDLWIATAGDGVCHVLDPEQLRGKPGRFDTSIERYTTKEGLTDNSATSIFQDREGNIWVGTYNGLDRFRKSSFIPIVPSPSTFWAMLVAADGGDIWIQSSSGVARIHDFTASSLTHLISSRLEMLGSLYPFPIAGRDRRIVFQPPTSDRAYHGRTRCALDGNGSGGLVLSQGRHLVSV
jgi:ligand-binding sensor domain-containing protein